MRLSGNVQLDILLNSYAEFFMSFCIFFEEDINKSLLQLVKMAILCHIHIKMGLHLLCIKCMSVILISLLVNI